MKLNFILLCLTGAVFVTVSILQPVYRTYHIIMSEVSWPDARNYCRTMYIDLAVFNTDQVWTLLYNESIRMGLTSQSWIGLYNDIDSWRWSLNDFPLKNGTLSNWYTGQPDNYDGHQSCGAMYTDGYWYDECCSDTRPFICFDARNSGAARFIGVASPLMNWTQAQNYCRSFHSDLASVLTQTDNDTLQQVVSNQGSSWIGLFRYTWKWIDGTNATNLPWRSGLPDNYYNADNCGAFKTDVVSDQPCSRLYYFICEGLASGGIPLDPPVALERNQQIVRLKVNSDGSVFDPAVQSFILDLIKQKLERNGMFQNITVTWRKQPDENIFYQEHKDYF